jgi:preprotein translocase subunit SecF
VRKLAFFFGIFALLQLTTAHAYIGPGAGAGMIAIVLGILSSVFLALVGILWFPIKRLLKRRKSAASMSNPTH